VQHSGAGKSIRERQQAKKQMLQKVIRALRFVVRRDRRRTEMPATKWRRNDPTDLMGGSGWD
jgi:hypothetical protein